MSSKDSKEDKDALDALELEAKEFDKDAEIDRILKAFRLDAYAVLDLQPGVPDSDIKVTYRKKSLLIHPDKTKNPLAPDAFDRLKKAQTELMDEKHRARLDEAIADARMLLIRENKWTVDSEELKTEEFRKMWRAKARDVLIDNEHRRRRQMKAQLQEEVSASDSMNRIGKPPGMSGSAAGDNSRKDRVARRKRRRSSSPSARDLGISREFIGKTSRRDTATLHNVALVYKVPPGFMPHSTLETPVFSTYTTDLM
ncbi:J domain-containing protein spf31 [Fusarium oxysporum f. sp. cubense race 1]|uniref:J domain-containing protein spf31 n=1 Tax=Fusarium oxysporum f. sp. cubense (strain race 1) TaxID=1229664 RepID=N4TPZ3_FUSC1|nr:J domain-containing protein spf31 [Fusarium oxysporum f. sp. cubense race 1]